MKKIYNLIRGNFYLRNIATVLIISLVLFFAVKLFLRIYTHHGQALSVPSLYGLSESDAEKELEKRNLKYKLIDSVYIVGEEPGVIVDQVPKPEYKVKKQRTIFLTINANSPEKIVMIDLIGYSYRQALYELNNRGLEIGKIIPVPDIKKGMVLRQKLGGQAVNKGDTILKGSKIDLEIGDGNSRERVRVPDLILLTPFEAKELLNNIYLNMAGIYDNTIQSQEDTLSAFAFRQKPSAKGFTRLPMGAFVDVWFTVDSTKMPGYDSLAVANSINEDIIYEEGENN